MINFGLDFKKNEEESKRETNYILGAVSDKTVLQQDGQWLDFDPMCEIQKSDYDDWMDCVSESATNVIKILLKRQFGIDEKWSVRFLAKMSGTSRSGNSLYSVADSLRNNGFVVEAKWNRNRGMNWDEYYKNIPADIKKEGINQKMVFDVSYERVPTTPDSLKNALNYAPVQVIGYAWINTGEKYVDGGNTPNHAFVLCGYDDNWKVYDSYPTDFQIDENSTKQEFIKILDKNFNFGDAMLYSIKKKDGTKESLLSKLKKKICSIIW